MPGCSARLARQIRVLPGSSLSYQGRQAEGPASWGAKEPNSQNRKRPPSVKAISLLHIWAVSTFKSGQRGYFWEGPRGACQVKLQVAGGFGVVPA